MGDIRILVVDDHPVMRRGLVEIISRKPGMRVVGEAGDGVGALAIARDRRPDVILLDIEMPGMHGLDILRRMRSEVPEARVIILTVYEDKRLVVEAVRRGAIGYLSKTCWPKELAQAIRAAHRGEPTLPSWAVPALIQALRSSGKSDGQRHPDELTGRELRILGLVAEGSTNKDIGEALGLTKATVRNQLAVIYQKLDVHNRAQAVARGYELELLPTSKSAWRAAMAG